MPELPEVETICRALASVLVGRKVLGVGATVSTLREPVDLETLEKNVRGKIKSVRRRAKFLVFDFAGRKCLIAHLGMTGSFRVELADAPLRKHDRVFFNLDKKEKLVYNDIRRFGVIKAATLGGEWPEEFGGFGPEPLEGGFSAEYLYGKLQRCKGPLKPFLMRQDIVVGVGNIYASEALFDCRVDPRRIGCEVTLKECAKIVSSIRKVLRASIRQGGTTFSDYRKPDGSEGKFVLRLKVYAREGQECKRRGCSGTISKIKQGGRSTFHCDLCQK